MKHGSHNLVPQQIRASLLFAWLSLPFLVLTFGSTPAVGQETTSDAKNIGTPIDKDDWDSFRNGNQLHGVAGSKLPAQLVERWSYDTKDGVPGTPTIAGGHVYCGILDGLMLCLDLKTGKEVWKTRSIDDPDPKTFAPGFKAAPLVTADAVYIGDEDGIFHCLDRQTGERRWSFETFGEIISSATRVDDRIVFGSYDNSLYCLDAATGKKLWHFETEGYVNCTPAIIDGYTFVTGCDEQLRVIDVQTGKQIKQMPLETYLIASPVIEGDFLYVGTYASEVIGVNWKELTIDWRYRGPSGEFPYHSSAALLGERLYVGGRDKAMHCINRLNGEKVWTFATRGKVDSSPVIVDERLFFGSDDGYLYELDLKTGAERWKTRIGRKVPGSPAVGENSLVIGTADRNGKLICFGEK